MPVMLDVKARLDPATAEQVAEEIRAMVARAVAAGVRDGLREAASPSIIDLDK